MPSVTYRELQATIDDLNVMKAGSTQFEYRTVVKNATNSPEPANEGMCVMIPYNTDDGSGYSSGKASSQMYYSKSGNVYTRSYYRDHKDHWGNWNKVSFGGGESTNAIIRPENENQITDANVLNYSGIFRTTNTTQNLPQGVDNPWGVLQHFYENNGAGNQDAKAGFQLYAPITGSGFGNLYIRVFNADHRLTGNSTWKKLNISKLIDMQDQVYTHPTTTLQEVTAETPTGFYLTTVDTQGLDGIPAEHKDGVLKVTKDGDISLQRFQPSVAGSKSVYVRTISATMQTRSAPDWIDINAEQLPKIYKPQDVQIHTPMDFATSKASGKVIYFYAGVQPMQLEKFLKPETMVIVQTIDGTGQSDTSHVGHIYQIAYAHDDNKIFTRKSSVPSSNNTWTEWKEIAYVTSTGGEAGQPINWEQGLSEAFKAWMANGEQKRTDEKAFHDWHKTLLKATFREWSLVKNPQSDTEQKAFEDYVLDKLEKSGGRYQKWIDYYKNPNQ